MLCKRPISQLKWKTKKSRFLKAVLFLRPNCVNGNHEQERHLLARRHLKIKLLVPCRRQSWNWYWKQRHRLARSLSWREPEFNPGVHMVEGES